MSRVVRVGFLQFCPVFGDRARNLDTIRRWLQGVDADLIVLPELCTTGYQFRDKPELHRLSEPARGELAETLHAIAVQTRTVIVAGFAERATGGVFNSAMTVSADGLLQVYRKVHLFDREKDLFLAGDTPFRPVNVGLPMPLGVMICFDWMFPEAARSLAIQGAGLIAHCANLVLPWCQRAMFARAVENGVAIITANRTGTEARWPGHPLTFTGNSQVMGPDGQVLAAADPVETAVHVVSVDLSACGSPLNDRNDRYRDRRPKMYHLDSPSRS